MRRTLSKWACPGRTERAGVAELTRPYFARRVKNPVRRDNTHTKSAPHIKTASFNANTVVSKCAATGLNLVSFCVNSECIRSKTQRLSWGKAHGIFCFLFIARLLFSSVPPCCRDALAALFSRERLHFSCACVLRAAPTSEVMLFAACAGAVTL